MIKISPSLYHFATLPNKKPYFKCWVLFYSNSTKHETLKIQDLSSTFPGNGFALSSRAASKRLLGDYAGSIAVSRLEGFLKKNGGRRMENDGLNRIFGSTKSNSSRSGVRLLVKRIVFLLLVSVRPMGLEHVVTELGRFSPSYQLGCCLTCPTNTGIFRYYETQ